MNINRLIKDLKNGNNPEENLSVYCQLLMASNQRLAAGDFAMDFTESYDYLAEAKHAQIKEGLALVTDIVKKYCSGSHKAWDTDTNRLYSCREHIRSNILHLEKYLLFFRIYEYVFNRLIYKFSPTPVPEDMQVFATHMMGYITEEKDPAEINSRIQTVLAELPVRLTTMKFLELLENGCLCFADARNDMVDHFFENLENYANPPQADVLSREWPQLYETAVLVENADTDTLTEESCQEIIDKIEAAGKLLAEDLSDHLQLFSLVNKLYMLLITTPYVVVQNKETTDVVNILNAYVKAIDSGDFLDIDADILGGLEKVVNNRQKYLGEHMLMEDVLEKITAAYASNIDGMMLSGPYMVLRTCARLSNGQSSDDIADIKPYKIADRAYVQLKIRHISEIYKESFKTVPQSIKRAMMSAAFDYIPVPFNSLDDVQRYIAASLEGCTNHSEGMASMYILNDLTGVGLYD